MPLHAPESVLEAVQAGDHRASLVALRDNLAYAIDLNPPARDLAALVNRLQSVLATLDDLPDPDGADRSAADDLAARRAARHSNPPDRARAAE